MSIGPLRGPRYPSPPWARFAAHWINCEQAGEEDVEASDVLAQISRIGGLTDLVYADGLPLSETTRAKLGQQSERVMQMARDRTFGR